MEWGEMGREHKKKKEMHEYVARHHEMEHGKMRI